jgi:hypothetical protein
MDWLAVVVVVAVVDLLCSLATAEVQTRGGLSLVIYT